MLSKLELKLAEFRDVFSRELTTKITHLSSLWQEVRISHSQAAIKQFRFEIHSLKGSSGALNFSALSSHLGLIEEYLKPGESNLFDITVLLTNVEELMDTLIEKTQRDINPFLEIDNPQTSSSLPSKEDNNDGTSIYLRSYRDITIALVDADQSVGALMTSLLSNFGFDFSYFTSIEELQAAQKYKHFKLVLLDSYASDSGYEGILSFAENMHQSNTLVFILSVKNDFEARLQAIRAKVTDYVLKPINITVLVSKIRKAFQIDLIRPYHILLLDDQIAVGSFYKTLLESQGAEVLALTDARDIMSSLESFHPDIFLLDLLMPNISGVEVATLIRQQSKYDFIPIVFLTSAADIDTKLSALEAGADDVIPKNTAASLFLKQIDYRIRRYQEIRHIASRDSLTGVLNHGQIMDAAAQTLALSARHTKPMILAMIDLDDFKKVNDSYGHISGDKVLVSLGQLLQQSVRETDFVGRYGGEEFMLVFSDADCGMIEQKMASILDAFHSIDFDINGQHFSCSFSAGLASSHSFDKLDQIISAADKALYKAKGAGKNQIYVDPLPDG